MQPETSGSLTLPIRPDYYIQKSRCTSANTASTSVSSRTGSFANLASTAVAGTGASYRVVMTEVKQPELLELLLTWSGIYGSEADHDLESQLAELEKNNLRLRKP